MNYRRKKKSTLRKYFVIFFSLLLLFQLSSNTLTGMNVEQKHSTEINLVSSSGIQITEANIASYSSSGTGSSVSDPYIIEDMNINTTDSLALEFNYVTSYFILRDSYCKGSTYGVYLTGVTSGVSQIINCTIEGGLSLGSINSHYMTVYNCTLRAGQGSLFSKGLNFTKNVLDITGPFSNTAINIRNEDNIFEDNIVYGDSSAVIINSLVNSTIKNNVLIGAGFNIYNDLVEKILSNVFENNIVNGKPYAFINGRSEQTITGNQYGQIYLLNSRDMIIQGYEMNNVNIGVQVYNCTDVTVRNVNVTGRNGIQLFNVDGVLVENCNWNGDDDGTEMWDVHNAIIQNNYMANFYQGIDCGMSNNIQIHNNTIFNSTSESVYCDQVDNLEATFNIISCFVLTEGSQLAVELDMCENVTLYYNIFISLGDLSAYPVSDWSCINIKWYNEILEIGNYYSDWNGLGTYSIESDIGSVDLYPVRDFDGDNLIEFDEVMIYFTDPFNFDSDSDGLNDGEEIETHETDPNDEDSDDDGYTDKEEVDAGTDPNDNTDYPSNPYIWLIVGLAGGFGAAVALTSFVVIRKRRIKTS